MVFFCLVVLVVVLSVLETIFNKTFHLLGFF